MSRKTIRFWVILGLVASFLLAGNFLLPFGPIPMPPAPNCGPEHWRWFDERLESTEDVVAFLQAKQSLLFSASHLPQLDPPEGTTVPPSVMAVDWRAVAQNIQVKQRLGYKIYLYKFQPVHCPGQSYTFKITTFGMASVYGCCGV